MTHSWAWWAVFHLLIALFLFLDLKVFFPRSKTIEPKKALYISAFWIALALLFNAVILMRQGQAAALQFLTGYIVEKSLSMDNLFVFALIFTHFKTNPGDQQKILAWGILGALFFRIILILSGVALITNFHWVLYLLGLFLCYTGYKLAFQKQEPFAPQKSLLFQIGKKFHLSTFSLILLLVEGTDVIFALDSIPAIFAITTDPFIIYTSNVFAVLGLRALYFAIFPSLKKLVYFKYGLGGILLFTGLKMLTASLIPISTLVSLAVIFTILIATVVFSLKKVKSS